MCFFFFFFFVLGKKKPSTKRLEEKRKCPPIGLPETSGHESKRRAKNHASRRRTTTGGGALTRRAKNVPIVGIVVTISPSLSLYKMVVLPAASRPTCVRFSAFYDERRISSVSTKEGEKKFRATDGLEEYIPRVQKATTTRPRDEARRPMFHRIGSPSIRKQSPPAAFFFRPVGSTTCTPSAQFKIQSSPFASNHSSSSSRMPFDVTTSTNPLFVRDFRRQSH